MSRKHEKFMNIAIALALKSKGKTSPNPAVGALVVKSGKVVGMGYHKKAGLAHAEIVALDEAKDKAKGSTLYVTLEPCTHFGKTPPCVYRVIESGIKEVVVGMIDPNPVNNGKGIAMLRRNDIRVSVGILENKVRKVNEDFIKYITKKLPFVTVKIAESLDGRIATRTGESKWITSDKSRNFAHRMRGNYDAVMVGINTVLRDNPRLEPWFSKRHPVKIVVDTRLSTPQNARIFEGEGPVWIITTPSQPGQETENRKILSRRARIIEVKEKDGQVNLKSMMKKIAQLGIMNVLVEGGGTLVGSLFDDRLVDKVAFFISPKIIGGRDALGSVMGKGIERIDRAVKLKDIKFRRIGEELFIEGNV